MFYEILGWASMWGETFNPLWVRADGTLGRIPGDTYGFGISSIGSGVAGGGPQNLPPLPLFGGASGIVSGFSLALIPEPTSMALAGLAAAVLLIFGRCRN
jgi:hypothetical protein